MTKDDKEFIKPWLIYHGEQLGYENLHIVDDSEDQEVLDFYKNHEHLNFHLHRDETGNRNLNNMEYHFEYIKNSIEEDNPYFIKMDADEFLFSLDKGRASSNIQEAIDMELNEFWLPQAQPPDIKYLKNENSEVLDCTNFTIVPNDETFYKQSFSQQRIINLGGHNYYNISNKSKKLAVIHFHWKRFEHYFDLAKKVCISHNYIHESDDDQQIINKLSKAKRGFSCHKVDFVLSVLTQKIDKDSWESSIKIGGSNLINFDFKYLKELKDSLKQENETSRT